MMQPPPPPQQQQQWAMAPPPPPQYYQAGHPPPPPPQFYQAGPPPPAMWGQPPPQAMPAPAPPTSGGGAGDEARTLWIGDLQYWMDENYLYTCFSQAGEVVSVKIIRNKQTGQPEGYGFIEFGNHTLAEQVLQNYNGQMMPNGNQPFKLNWATSGAGDKRGDDGPDYTIFVGDLASDVTDFILQDTFKSRYPSVKGAKVVFDRTTGRSKGYGFVKFGDSDEQTRAMTEMNGQYCSSRPMRLGPASSKKNNIGQQQPSSATYQNTQGTDSDNDPNNTTVFVGGLDPSVTDDLLRQTFGPYGELLYVKIPLGKRCGFVQYSNRASAEEAIRVLNGSQLGGQSIRLSWGRSPANKQPQQEQNQWSGGYYGYPQGYDPYGYARPPQDPAMYTYAAYPGYGNYQQQPPQQPPPQQ
ncbi:hypothetical protein U9M48_009806 [Paspalum notatum var. saurae]|uniref:RRM domain-containing protein n=1 Tax=Paspalum notatum var. saurae TaxID=547442 RepID=A0AAQ3WFJ3_PASNO